MTKGKIIAAFGISGSGKSTVSREVGKLLKIETIHEFEEAQFPLAFVNRAVSGNFRALMSLNVVRVPMLYIASQKRNNGETVLLDTFYDKLLVLYMDKDGMQWLFNKADPYYKEMKGIAEKDYHNLPDIDCLLFFHVDKETWHLFLNKRNRKLDNEENFRSSNFKSQVHFLEAAKKYCSDKGCKLIVFHQKYSSPKQAAEKVVAELINQKIIIY
ncbi:MAG: hypothetical protein R3A50_16585 [Saprospiraceae bacterium]